MLGWSRGCCRGVRRGLLPVPVLDPHDPPYRGIRIPRRFWRIAAWTTAPDADSDTAKLEATGYLLDQSPQLDRIDLTNRKPYKPDGPPPLGAYRTYQVPIADLAALTGIDLGPLPAADRLPAPAQTATGESRWRRLRQLSNQAL